MPYSYSQPSASDSSGTRRMNFEEASAAYEAELELRSKGIPKNCACGAETEIVNYVGPLHAGRRFFSCPNYDDGNEHMWKGFDNAMMEDFAKQSQELKDVKEELTSVKYDVGDITFKMHFLTVGDSKEVRDDHKNAHDEISVLKERMVKFDDEIGELNKKSVKINVLFVVATVIVIVALLMSYKC